MIATYLAYNDGYIIGLPKLPYDDTRVQKDIGLISDTMLAADPAWRSKDPIWYTESYSSLDRVAEIAQAIERMAGKSTEIWFVRSEDAVKVCFTNPGYDMNIGIRGNSRFLPFMPVNVKSVDHIRFDRQFEYFKKDNDLYRAPIMFPLDIDGHRYGAMPVNQRIFENFSMSEQRIEELSSALSAIIGK